MLQAARVEFDQPIEQKATAKHRSPGLDVAKLLAALCVICIHACRSPELAVWTNAARWAVPFFTAAAGYGCIVSYHRQPLPFRHFFVQRFKRLYLPFLVWSVAYIAFKLAKVALLPSLPCDLPGWEILWVGGAYHLWFIPFLIVVSLALYPWMLIGQCSRVGQIACCVGFAIAGLIAGQQAPSDDGNGHFLVLVAQTLPALLWGCSLAWLTLANGSLRIQSWVLLSLLAGSVGLLLWGPRGCYLENVAGLSLFMLVMPTAQPAGQGRLAESASTVLLCRCAALGQVAMGIYYCHLMILKMGEALLAKLRFEISPASDLLLVVITMALSIVVAKTMAAWQPTRWLVA